MSDIVSKIKKMKLTKADANIAEYILDNLDTIGILTSSDLAEKIGVSDTSVIRFVRKLGFRGYAEFRGEMNARMAAQYTQSQTMLMPSEKYTKTKDRLNKNGLVRDVSSYILDNLEDSISRLEDDTINRIADILIASRRKFIAGFRGTVSCTYYLANRLLLLLPDVRAITHADASAVESLMDITDQDCLIVFSFPKYSEINQVLIDLARKRGARIILITDRQTSAIALPADIAVITKIDGLGFTNSYIAPMAISEMILLAVSSRGKDICDKRIHELDRVINDEKLY